MEKQFHATMSTACDLNESLTVFMIRGLPFCSVWRRSLYSSLGYSAGIQFDFMTGLESVALEDVDCFGDEYSLETCVNGNNQVTPYDSNDAVGLKCFSGKTLQKLSLRRLMMLMCSQMGLTLPHELSCWHAYSVLVQFD